MRNIESGFKNCIKKYLDEYASRDKIFKGKYDPEKLETCCKFIIAEVNKANISCCSDDYVYQLSRHYYDEGAKDDFKEVSCKVIYPNVIGLTQEEKDAAKKAAWKEIKNQEEQRILLEEKKKNELEKIKIKKKQEQEKKKKDESGQIDIFSFIS